MHEAFLHTVPVPSGDWIDGYAEHFEPAPELWEWAHYHFVRPESPLYNVDHLHLQDATIGFLWTNVENVYRNARIIGQASLGRPTGSDAWKRARNGFNLLRFFGRPVDFVITLDALWWLEKDNVSRCAVLEHELAHCGIQHKNGMPQFHRDGTPVYGMKGHDVEEHFTVIRRYGTWSDQLRDAQTLIERGPTIGRAQIDGICGTCACR